MRGPSHDANLLAADLDHVLEHVGPAWDDLRDARLLITGGTGFFGRWLLESLLWANDRRALRVHASVLTRRPERFAASAPHLASHPAVHVIGGDMVAFSLPAGRLDLVVHAATETVGLPGSFDPEMRARIQPLLSKPFSASELARLVNDVLGVR